MHFICKARYRLHLLSVNVKPNYVLLSIYSSIKNILETFYEQDICKGISLKDSTGDLEKNCISIR